MAKQFDRLTPEHQDFIAKQRVFFTASAAANGPINLSPKGLGGFRILGPDRACYLNLTGSGNETAAHALADGRLTIMFCAFEGPPMILRLYGRAESHERGGAAYQALLQSQYGGDEPPGARQIIEMTVEMVQTSCGFAVPLYDYKAERPSLVQWAANTGEEGLKKYRSEKNRVSLGGLPTGLPEG